MTNGNTNSNKPIDSNIPPRITENGPEDTTPVTETKSSIIPDPIPNSVIPPVETEKKDKKVKNPKQPEVLTMSDVQKLIETLNKNEEERVEREKQREEEHQQKMKELSETEASLVRNSVSYQGSINAVKNDVSTQISYENKKDRMKQKWADEVKRGEVATIYIPKPAGEPDGIKFHVQFNGAIVEFEKDTYIDNVPKSLADEVKKCLQQQKDAGKAMRLDLNSDLQKHLDASSPLLK